MKTFTLIIMLLLIYGCSKETTKETANQFEEIPEKKINSINNTVKKVTPPKSPTLTDEIFQEFKKILINKNGSINGKKVTNDFITPKVNNVTRIVILDEISDFEIDYLKYFKSLNTVELNLKSTKSLYALSSLKKLESLYAIKPGNVDFSPLSALATKLTIVINGNSGQSLRGIENVNALHTLKFYNVDKISLGNLSKSNSLKRIIFGSMKHIPLEDLAGLKVIEYLDFRNPKLSYKNNITDIEPLKNLKTLKKLILGHCQQLTKFPNEVHWPELSELTIKYAKVENYKAIGELLNLEYLDLQDNSNFSDTSIFKKLQKMKSLNLTRTSVKDISFIDNFNKLKYLYWYNFDSKKIQKIKKKFPSLDIRN